MDSPAIKVVFFDIGGVILSNGWGSQSRRKASENFGIDFDSMELLHKYMFHVYEMGKVSLDEYLDIVIFNQPRDFSKASFQTFMFNQTSELPDMLPWLIEWKAQHPDIQVFSINNEAKELNAHRVQMFKLRRLFDGFISSGEVGFIKPDPDIFRLALGVVQVDPRECVYFDDHIELVESAQRLGIQGYQHTSYENTKAIFDNLNFFKC